MQTRALKDKKNKGSMAWVFKQLSVVSFDFNNGVASLPEVEPVKKAASSKTPIATVVPVTGSINLITPEPQKKSRALNP